MQGQPDFQPTQPAAPDAGATDPTTAKANSGDREPGFFNKFFVGDSGITGYIASDERAGQGPEPTMHEADIQSDPSNPELQRKLELAEEFRQIGDIDGARDLLKEVVAKNAEGEYGKLARAQLAQLDPNSNPPLTLLDGHSDQPTALPNPPANSETPVAPADRMLNIRVEQLESSEGKYHKNVNDPNSSISTLLVTLTSYIVSTKSFLDAARAANKATLLRDDVDLVTTHKILMPILERHLGLLRMASKAKSIAEIELAVAEITKADENNLFPHPRDKSLRDRMLGTLENKKAGLENAPPASAAATLPADHDAIAPVIGGGQLDKTRPAADTNRESLSQHSGELLDKIAILQASYYSEKYGNFFPNKKKLIAVTEDLIAIYNEYATVKSQLDNLNNQDNQDNKDTDKYYTDKIKELRLELSELNRKSLGRRGALAAWGMITSPIVGAIVGAKKVGEEFAKLKKDLAENPEKKLETLKQRSMAGAKKLTEYGIKGLDILDKMPPKDKYVAKLALGVVAMTFAIPTAGMSSALLKTLSTAALSRRSYQKQMQKNLEEFAYASFKRDMQPVYENSYKTQVVADLKAKGKRPFTIDEWLAKYHKGALDTFIKTITMDNFQADPSYKNINRAAVTASLLTGIALGAAVPTVLRDLYDRGTFDFIKDTVSGYMPGAFKDSAKQVVKSVVERAAPAVQAASQAVRAASEAAKDYVGDDRLAEMRTNLEKLKILQGEKGGSATQAQNQTQAAASAPASAAPASISASNVAATSPTAPASAPAAPVPPEAQAAPAPQAAAPTPATAAPVVATPALLTNFPISPGDYLEKIMKDHLPILKGLTPEQQNNIIYNFLERSAGKDWMEKNYITNMNRIFTGNKIDLQSLSDAISRTRINGQTLLERARDL